jgi:hypothetical protein
MGWHLTQIFVPGTELSTTIIRHQSAEQEIPTVANWHLEVRYIFFLTKK